MHSDPVTAEPIIRRHLERNFAPEVYPVRTGDGGTREARAYRMTQRGLS